MRGRNEQERNTLGRHGKKGGTGEGEDVKAEHEQEKRGVGKEGDAGQLR